MVEIVCGPVAAGITVGTSQEAANAASAFEAAAQVIAPCIADGWRVADIPLLDDAHAVVEVTRLRLQDPIGVRRRLRGRKHIFVLLPLAQPAQPVVDKIRQQIAVTQDARTDGVGSPLHQPVLVIIGVNLVIPIGSGEIAVAVIG